MSINAICVFCGAQNNVPQQHIDIGQQLGDAIAKAGKKLVYGGGDCGIMGAVANAALEASGWVTGVFPHHLRDLEKEHQSLSEIFVVDSMHERKQMMYEKSDAFIILPGGFGTLDEMFEILTWRQLRLHQKPVVIYNHEGYWSHLIALMQHIIDTGFARAETSTMYETVDDFAALTSRFDL